MGCRRWCRLACRHVHLGRRAATSFQETIDNFGGSSTTKFGLLLHTLYPEAGSTPTVLIDNFNSGDQTNPCPVG
jgi:hypothetical protein